MYPDGLSLCHVWRFYFQPFWFYRTDRQTDNITEADQRYTHTITVGVSKGKGRQICIAPHQEKLTSEALSMDHTAFYTANYTMLPSPRKHSPVGVTTG